MAQWIFNLGKKKLYAPNGDYWPAVSGGLGAHIPPGEYDLQALVVDTRSTFCDPTHPKDCWFIPLNPHVKMKRRGFGVHPDGGPPGTHGCIGLQPGCDMRRALELLRAIPV